LAHNATIQVPGFLLSVVIHSNSVQDRDGARDVLRQARRRASHSSKRSSPMPAIRGQRWRRRSRPRGPGRIVIIKRFDAHRFVILPKRWIVERTLAWISRNRRLARDFIGS
jgi:putative transposase